MTGATARRVRVTIEGTAHEVSQRCDILRIELDRGGEQGGASFLLSPDWPDVSVEDVTQAYGWQDGDAVHSTSSTNNVAVRSDDQWNWSRTRVSIDDRHVDELITQGQVAVLRYQAGEA